MTDTDRPVASSRTHVVDMFYAALTTLPCGGGAGDPGPRADEGLAIDPELGTRIAGLLSRLYFGREDIGVTMKQPNGGSRTYQVSSLRHDCRGEEGPDRPASFVASVLRVAQFGAATRLTVTLRWVGGNCWLNLQANPTTLLVGTNACAADTGLQGECELLYLLRYPFRLLRRILRTIDPAFDWSAEMADRIRRGDILAHNLQFAFSIPFGCEDDACRFLSWLQASYCLQYVDERGRVRVLGELLGLRASAEFDDDGRSTGVLLRARQGNTPTSRSTPTPRPTPWSPTRRRCSARPGCAVCAATCASTSPCTSRRSGACSPPPACRARRAPAGCRCRRGSCPRRAVWCWSCMWILHSAF